MNPFLNQDHEVLHRRVRSWVENSLIRAHKEESNIDNEARRLLGQLSHEGFTSYVAPKQFGGVREQVQARDLCLIREQLARGSALADAMFALQALGSYPILIAGSEAQKARYLPPLASGAAIAAFALTEPQAGSDVSSLETRALKRGGDYRLTGTKHFISNAGIAQTYVVFASTDPDKKGKGISAFIVEADAPGLILKEKTRLLSPHPIGALAFNDCIVPQSQLLGSEGEGLKIALRSLDTLRCTVGAAAVGLAQRALDEAVGYSQNRRQFGHALSEFQGTQLKLADMATELEASRLLVYQAAWIHDHGENGLPLKSSMAKLFATETAQRVIDQSLQIHGGVALVSGHPIERLYRDVRALRIYEGTSEIQKLVIAKNMLMEGRPHGI
jgi:acyl-CoA dehydrogenase